MSSEASPVAVDSREGAASELLEPEVELGLATSAGGLAGRGGRLEGPGGHRLAHDLVQFGVSGGEDRGDHLEGAGRVDAVISAVSVEALVKEGQFGAEDAVQRRIGGVHGFRGQGGGTGGDVRVGDIEEGRADRFRRRRWGPRRYAGGKEEWREQAAHGQ